MILTNSNNNEVGTWFQQESTLGDTTSVFFKVSADAESSWENKIFHNSRFGIFHLYTENGKMKLELTAKGLDTRKFRKATVRNEAAAINAVLEWVGAIREESVFIGSIN